MTYEVAESRRVTGEWVVEAINEAGEGEVYVTIFSGPLAKQRAEEYAAWKSANNPLQRQSAPRTFAAGCG
jgi:hypothetical protein